MLIITTADGSDIRLFTQHVVFQPWQIMGKCLPYQLSNEKNPTGCLGYIGDYTTQLYRDNFINHEIRIPINQPVKWKVGRFFSWLNWLKGFTGSSSSA